MGGLAKKLLATAVEQSLEPIAGAVDFDGTNDYLSRSSDLLGNISGKTFTFSSWVWLDSTSTSTIYDSLNNQFRVAIEAGGSITIRCQNSGGSVVLAATSEPGSVPQRTWAHVLISIDLSNSANRSIYVNGVLKSATWETYSLTGTIWFPAGSHAVGRERQLSINYLKGRLAHLYLDYTYRDLSIEANRRLFITADRKPAEGLEALNPILYLPMTDPTQPGKNLGTGGDFALTGVVARSGRGPNQFNVAYSDLDGSSDYLSRATAPTGIADGKAFTFACVLNPDTHVSAGGYIISFADSTNRKFDLLYDRDGKYLTVKATNSSNVDVLSFTTEPGSIPTGRNCVVSISIDLADTGKRHINVNGIIASASWNTYTNDVIDFTGYATPRYRIGSSPTASSFFGGRLGNVFFDTRYIDLSQPDNLAKFVTGTGIDAKPVDLGANGEKPFGTPPLIYLTMYGNNAGKNYGTGGDFTVNSGPFPGARGPNEYWGNKADFNGATGYLARNGGLSGASDGKTFSLSFFISPDVLTGSQFVLFPFDSGGNRGGVLVTSTVIRIIFNNGTSTLLDVSFTHGMSAGLLYHFCCAVDLSSTAKRPAFINGVQVSGQTWAAYVNAIIPFSSGLFPSWAIGSANGAAFLDGKLSEFYFTTDYIDFSQEANRLKFRDAFGNPVALLPQIEAGEIPNPAIYMRFDPANFGKNYGTGGDFTVNGTITDGGQL